MIVDTMTFEEVTKYFYKHCFSSESIKHITDVYYKNQMKYAKETRKWLKKNNKEPYKIFKPIIYKETTDDILVGVPYASTKKFTDFVFFTTFYYKGGKYLAFKLNPFGKNHGNDLMCFNKYGLKRHPERCDVRFFTWHSLKRYAERYLGKDDVEIDDVFIGEMLAYNTQYIETKYTYKGKETNMSVCRDGAFLCEKYNDLFIAKTFISESEYFSNQSSLDKEAFETLKLYKAYKYGDIIERD